MTNLYDYICVSGLAINKLLNANDGFHGSSWIGPKVFLQYIVHINFLTYNDESHNDI